MKKIMNAVVNLAEIILNNLERLYQMNHAICFAV